MFFFSGKAFCQSYRGCATHVNKSDVLDGIIMFPKCWDSVIEKQGGYIEELWTNNLKETKMLIIKNIVYISFEMTFVFKVH